MSIISIHVTAEKLSEFLESYRKKAENLTPVMKGIAEELHSETMLNFEQQGRPKWPDLSAVTRRIRAERNQDPNGPILKVSGQLRNSIMASSDASTATLTAGANTNKTYAAIQQFGGQAGKGRKVTIPARPYMPFIDNTLQPEAEDAIIAFVKDHFGNVGD